MHLRVGLLFYQGSACYSLEGRPFVFFRVGQLQLEGWLHSYSRVGLIPTLGWAFVCHIAGSKNEIWHLPLQFLT